MFYTKISTTMFLSTTFFIHEKKIPNKIISRKEVSVV